MSSVGSFRKNGLVIFGSRMASIATGMLFLLMVTGWLRPERFGLWEVITDLVTFASYPAGLFAFWASRDIARGKLVGRTAIELNLAMSTIGIAAYALFSVPTFGQFNSTYAPFLLAALLIPLSYWNQAAASVAIGYRPAAMGYSLLVSEAAKLVVAYPALFIFKLEINGVILAMITAYFVQSLVITVLARGAVLPKADLALGKKWISDAWIPALYLIPPQIAIADTLVGSIASGSTLVTGYYQAAFSLGSMVSYAGLVASALYPLLLRGGTAKAPSITLNLILLFAIPMATGVAVLAPHLLRLLSPLYVSSGSDVSIAVGILAGWGLLTALSFFTDNTLIGLETADLNEKKTLGSYVRSSFLFVAGINIGYLSFTLVGVYAIVSVATVGGYPLGITVQAWAAIQSGLLAPAIMLKLWRVKERTSVDFPRGLPYFVLCSAVMAVFLWALTATVPPPGADRTLLGEWVVVAIIAGGGSYFGVLLLVDKETRELARAFAKTMSSL